MPRINDQLFRRLKQLAAEHERSEREALKRRFPEDEPRTPRYLFVNEYYCPDCKHRMWAQEIAEWWECSSCGFQGKFEKRED